MNYDTITYYCSTEKWNVQEGSYLTDKHRFLKVTMLLNGEEVKWSRSVDPCSVALKSLDNRPRYGFWGELIPGCSWSSFEPFTCSCGDSGCIGIWDGIHVRVRKHSVEWRAKKDDGYSFLPKTFFNFKRKQYEAAVTSFIEQIKELSADSTFTLVVDPGYCEEVMVTGEDFLNYVEGK